MPSNDPEYDKKYRLKNKEKKKLIDKKYYENNKEKMKKNQETYYYNNTEKIKNKWLIKKYNLTLKEYNERLKNQGDNCPICNNSMTKSYKGPCLDHDHENNKIREFLCHKCNSTLGFVKENPIIIKKLYNYLMKHKTDEQIEKYGIVKIEKEIKQLDEKIKIIENELMKNLKITADLKNMSVQNNI